MAVRHVFWPAWRRQPCQLVFRRLKFENSGVRLEQPFGRSLGGQVNGQTRLRSLSLASVLDAPSRAAKRLNRSCRTIKHCLQRVEARLQLCRAAIYKPGGFGTFEIACLHSELKVSSLLFRHATTSGPCLPGHSFSTCPLHAL